MFRPLSLAAAIVIMLAGCAQEPVRPVASPAITAPAPTSGAAGLPVVPKATPPAASRPQGDGAPLLNNADAASDIDSCRQRCERQDGSCMDSVASRSQGGALMEEGNRLFTPTGNCQAQLQRCFDRCRP